MNTKIKVSEAMFFSLVILGFFVSIAASFTLPERFFNDTKIIIFDEYREAGWIGSYPFTIMFYKLTLLKYLPFYIITIIQFPVIFYVIYKIGIPSYFHIINVKNTITYIGFFLIAIFMCMPSKEFINFIYIYVILLTIVSAGISKQKKIIYLIILFVIFGFFFRPYYYFIPIIAFGMYLIKFIKFKNRTIMSIFYGILIAVFLSLSHGLIKGQYLSESTRDEHNAVRTKDANSMIIPPIATDTWYGETVGILYGFFAVNLPLSGLKYLFSPQIIGFVIWQLTLFYILFVRFRRSILNPNSDYEELWVLLILFAYFIVQGVFEPDLGSAIRHKIGVFPLIYFALYYDNFRKDSSKIF